MLEEKESEIHTIDSQQDVQEISYALFQAIEYTMYNSSHVYKNHDVLRFLCVPFYRIPVRPI